MKFYIDGTFTQDEMSFLRNLLEKLEEADLSELELKGKMWEITSSPTGGFMCNREDGKHSLYRYKGTGQLRLDTDCRECGERIKGINFFNDSNYLCEECYTDLVKKEHDLIQADDMEDMR